MTFSSADRDTVNETDRPTPIVNTAVTGWTVCALGTLLAVPLLLDTTTPIFQVLWLLVPLIHLLRFRDAHAVGVRPLGLRRAITMAGIAGAVYAALLFAVEPRFGVYDRLLELALAGPDPTFAWLIRFDGAAAWLGLALFSGFVTLYSEELFFRGWLLGALKRRTHHGLAVVGQAIAFTLFQSLPVLFFSPIHALLYLVVYTFGLGVILGVVADRTESILPGLAVVTVANLVLTALLV